ncbi:MAG: hypothetical protein R3D27_03800 [Hyphomicrobiaceae bacterium]
MLYHLSYCGTDLATQGKQRAAGAPTHMRGTGSASNGCRRLRQASGLTATASQGALHGRDIFLIEFDLARARQPSARHDDEMLTEIVNGETNLGTFFDTIENILKIAHGKSYFRFTLQNLCDSHDSRSRILR